jgi:hypothetical protein
MKWYRRDSKERTGDSGPSLLKLEKTLLIQGKEYGRLEYETGAKERELWRWKSESMYGLILCILCEDECILQTSSV